MIEGSVELGGATLRVQDEQLMIYFPEGEGTSVPLEHEEIWKLVSFSKLALMALEQKQA